MSMTAESLGSDTGDEDGFETDHRVEVSPAPLEDLGAG